MNLTARIPETRLLIARGSYGGEYLEEKAPSRLYRMALKPTKSPYNFSKTKRRRKIAKLSRKANRK